MDLERFQNLPTEEVARRVRAAGTRVVVFPVNGTRRWLVLEHPEPAAEDFLDAYYRIGGKRMIEVFRLFFDHGIETLLTPVFGPDLLERGDEYVRLAVEGLLWFARDPDFVDFYTACDVRVRVYGDAWRYFHDTPYAHVLDAFDEITRRTAHHRRHRLFFGICAHDATESVAEIGIRFHRQHGRAPNRHEIVTEYYGEYLDPVSFFVGFERPAAFDMPLLATGSEDLYFTVSPSLYLNEHTLRAILHDHLYARRVDEATYAGFTPQDWAALAELYTLNRQHVIGVGGRSASGGFWYPLSQVVLPPQLAKTERATREEEL